MMMWKEEKKRCSWMSSKTKEKQFVFELRCFGLVSFQNQEAQRLN